MNKNKKSKRKLFLSMLTNPVFILVYAIAFYELDILCRVGRKDYNTVILPVCAAFFLIYLIIFIIRIVKNLRNGKIDKVRDDLESDEDHKSVYKTLWSCIAIVIIVFITLFYGTRIYHSSQKYNGKLAWFLKDLEDKRTVTFVHNNIYNDGIEGIFTDIKSKITMPEKLYISTNFAFKFNSSGTITSLDTFIYGKNSKGKMESFLISYDSVKSNKITIYLNGYAKPDYSEDKLLEPLFKTMKVIPIKKTISNWKDQKEYGILYSGKRSFGYSTTGVVYIDGKGNTKQAYQANSEIIGYFVSVYVPGKENAYTPVRYNFTDDLNNIKSENENNNISIGTDDNNKPDVAEQFYLSKKIGYRLEVTAAAAGSRSYSLASTSDGGATWKTINQDPFSGKLGVAAGITFLNDKLGFLCLSYSGGKSGELYRTEDGGLSYKKLDFPAVKATLKGGETYNPFDLPEMPYNKNGNLNVLVGQGAYGDYNGGSKALYQSSDEGKTWHYVQEVVKN